MSQVKREDDPIAGASWSGLWRSSMAQIEIYRGRPAPTCAFLLSLACWSAAVVRIWSPELSFPQGAGACLSREAMFAPSGLEWRRYGLHALWPLEPSYMRGFLTSIALLLEGYALEYEIGTPHFAALLLGTHVMASAALLRFGLTTCFTSLEPAIAGLAVATHRINPKIHTDGLDKSIRVPFAVEPRWHLWIVQSALLMLAVDFPRALLAHGVGYALGALCVLRDPEAVVEAFRAVRGGSTRIGYCIHVALLLFSIFFMPLSAEEYPADFFMALMDGRAFGWSWWRGAFPGTPPLIHLAFAGAVPPQALYLCKILITLAIPLLLSPFTMWVKGYSIGCVILVMYAMTSELWRLPHVGFVVLLYLAWAFWKLPNMEHMKQY